jgi:cytidylate kinase
VYLDGVDASELIRSADVTEAASVVALNPAVRQELVEQQRRIAEGLNIVCEGRDQGTVVFPLAPCKLFLTADPLKRALRRKQEASGQDLSLSLEEIRQQIEERDRRDANRDLAPLKPADDAIVIDTSHLDQNAVVDLLEKTVRSRLQLAHRR